MMTRQTNRKPLTLPGRYHLGKGRGAEVTLSTLSRGGCRFVDEEGHLAAGTRIHVYIDDAGPFPAQVRWVREGQTGVTFATPLDQAQLAHFRNCHVALHRETDSHTDPDSLAAIKPRRYC